MITSESVDMSLDDDFHEPRFSDDRKKLDGFSLFGTESPEDIENLAGLSEVMNRMTIQSEPNYNVRNSLAWDSAFFASPGVLEPEELFRSVNSQIVDSAADIFGCEDEILLPSGSLEPHVKSRTDRCDLRKSLAWDSAFFSNAGVLDAKELAIVNRGFKKSETHLHGIEEDVTISTESSFSLDSGTSSLTSLEIDLFEDIRESWHKSTNKRSLPVSSLELRRQNASNKLDVCSRTRMDSPALKRKNINSNVTEGCTMKTPLSVPSRKRLAAGNTSSSVKPPKSADIFRNSSAVSTKRASCSEKFAKVGTAKAASGEGCLANSKKINLKNLKRCSTPTPTSSSLGFPAEAQKLDSCSLSNSDSVLKTPMKYSIRNKTKPESCGHTSHEFSATKSSDFSSPGSYIDGWSSESSISMTQRSKNLKAFKGASCRHVYFEDVSMQKSALSRNLPDQSLAQASQERRPSSRNYRTPLRTVSLPSRMSKNTKPSDLRVPSPKLGYFDSEISSVVKRDRSAEFHKQIAKLKVGSGTSNPNKPAANQPINGDPEISRTIWQQNGLQSALQVIHKRSTLVEEIPLDETAASATIKICFPTTYNIENNSPHGASCKDCAGIEKPKSEEQNAAAEGVLCSSRAENERDEVSVENTFGCTKHNEIIIVQKGRKSTHDEREKQTHSQGDGLRVRNDNKENVYSFKDQVDGVVIELKVSKNSSDAQSAVLTLII